MPSLHSIGFFFWLIDRAVLILARKLSHLPNFLMREWVQKQKGDFIADKDMVPTGEQLGDPSHVGFQPRAWDCEKGHMFRCPDLYFKNYRLQRVSFHWNTVRIVSRFTSLSPTFLLSTCCCPVLDYKLKIAPEPQPVIFKLECLNKTHQYRKDIGVPYSPAAYHLFLCSPRSSSGVSCGSSKQLLPLPCFSC